MYVFAGGIDEGIAPVLVAADGTVTTGGYAWARPLNGDFTVLELSSHDEAVSAHFPTPICTLPFKLF